MPVWVATPITATNDIKLGIARVTMTPEGGSKVYDRRPILTGRHIGDNDGRRAFLTFECEGPKTIF